MSYAMRRPGDPGVCAAVHLFGALLTVLLPSPNISYTQGHWFFQEPNQALQVASHQASAVPVTRRVARCPAQADELDNNLLE